jgi:hypothetical protein
VHIISPGLSNVVANACPDLQCLPGIDLSRANPSSISGVSVSAKGAQGTDGLFSILPISLLVNINRFMFGTGKPSDPRTQCGVPVLSGAELLAFKVDDVEQGFFDAVSAAAKKTGLNVVRSSLVSSINNQVRGVCSNLPIEHGSTLAARQYIWGAIGTMQLQVVLDVMYVKYPWF